MSIETNRNYPPVRWVIGILATLVTLLPAYAGTLKATPPREFHLVEATIDVSEADEDGPTVKVPITIVTGIYIYTFFVNTH